MKKSTKRELMGMRKMARLLDKEMDKQEQTEFNRADVTHMMMNIIFRELKQETNDYNNFDVRR